MQFGWAQCEAQVLLLVSSSSKPSSTCENILRCASARQHLAALACLSLLIVRKEATAAADKIYEHFIRSVYNSCSTTMLAVTSTEIRPSVISFSFSPVTVIDIYAALANMALMSNSSKNDVTLRQLHLSSPEILPVLTNIFNLSLRTQIFHTRWKHSLVTPVYKKCHTHDIGNYRPILILPAVPKLLEAVIDMQVREFLTLNQLILTNQHGFIKGRSYETVLVNLSFSLFSARDESLYAAIAALDFTNIFDTGRHDVSFAKFSYLDFDSLTCEWFNYYISVRTQSIRYSGCTTQSLTAMSGMLEGNVVDPLPFAIYINDLLASLFHDSVMAYADDVMLAVYDRTEAAAVNILQTLVNIGRNATVSG